jgi:hypothetical protein
MAVVSVRAFALTAAASYVVRIESVGGWVLLAEENATSEEVEPLVKNSPQNVSTLLKDVNGIYNAALDCKYLNLISSFPKILKFLY